VPAASGNLGSGFDSAGLSLALYNETVADTELEGVQIEGSGAEYLPADERNHCVRAMHELAARAGRPLPPFGLRLHNRIPVGRGLASSGAAVISGLLLANALLGEPCGRGELIDLGTELEGHPDNVAAAMLGGAVVSVWDGVRVEAVRIQPPPGMSAVLWVPEVQLETKRARAALPEVVPMHDAVFNLSHAALFAAALATGQWDRLRTGAQDRLHQPYRAPLVAGLYEIMAVALDAGALASWLSGAGPCVLALCLGDTTRVEELVHEMGCRYAGSGTVMRVGIDLHGAQVEVG
jgi:homoserine kinase